MIDFFIAHFSYGILFIWSILEGEIGLTLAGYMVKVGKFDLPQVLLLTIGGALIGDTAVFLTGRLFKTKTEILLKNYEEKMQRIESWFLHYGSWIVIFERFVYGTHIPALLMLGVSGFSFWKFLLLDIIGVVLWAVTFTTLGYYFGHTVIDLLTFVQRHLTIALLVILFFYIIYLLQKEEEV
ncbi:membrane protein [Sulfurovum lithotrophicum]|uniref:Membrane protein n=1 Tax=Sulfurovum lithotrophicum TaxID=206403 RepID=A0A7U4M162_9BACT|nr:DedA family protein [Sulfurovum lithotrophicum]AKF24983.1 membrane protein [Sulfurovum lithotrophicum]